MPYLHTISTLGCPKLTLVQLAALVRDHSLDGVELRALAGTIDLPGYFASTYRTPATLAEEVRRLGLRVLALDTSFRLADGDDAARDELLAFAPWAEALGLRWLRVFDGGKRDGAALESRALANLAWWRRERETHRWGCDLMTETHDSLLTAERINSFVERAEGAAILWDSHHTWRFGGEDPCTTWAAIKKHVVHVHVKDSVAASLGSAPMAYVLPGLGEFPMARLQGMLMKEFSGSVSLEWERLWHPELAPLDEALDAARVRCWW